MPELGPKRRNSCPKEPFPDPEAQQQCQIIADPQISTAQAEGGEEPAGPELQTDDQLAEAGQPPVQGLPYIRAAAQQHSRQEAAQEPAPHSLRTHRHSPRFGLASS